MKRRWIVHKWSEYPSRFCTETRLMHWVYRAIGFVIDNTILRDIYIREEEAGRDQSKGN